MEYVEILETLLSTTIDKLYKTIDFLQNEIEAKHLMIKNLMFSNANGEGKVDMELILIQLRLGNHFIGMSATC